MGIVNELQASAESDSVANLLRKAKRVAAKLKRMDIDEWLGHEQDGYPDGANLPEYRRVHATVCFDTNGPVPVGGWQTFSGIQEVPGSGELMFPVVNPIATIDNWIARLGSGNQVMREIDGESAEVVKSALREMATRPEYVSRFKIYAKLNENEIRQIPESVRNRILDWALDLERAGISGEGQSFTDNEVRSAQGVVVNIDNSTNKVHAPGFSGVIQNASPHATQNATVTINPDVSKVLDRIQEIIVSARIDEADRCVAVANIELVRTLAAGDTKNPKIRERILLTLGTVADVLGIYAFLQPDIGLLIDQMKGFFS